MYESVDIVRRVIPSVDTSFQVAPTQFMTLLLHGDTSFADATQRHLMTGSGGAVISSSQSKFGGGSLSYTSGASSFTSIRDQTSDFNFPGDFTIDFWVKANTFPGVLAHLFNCDPSAALTNRYSMDFATDGSFDWNITGVSVVGGAAGSISTSAFTHIAVTRYGNTTRPFTNGVVQGTYTGTENLANGSAFVIGARADGLGLFFDGWIDEFRVMKGVAVWTANFTPPASPYSAT